MVQQTSIEAQIMKKMNAVRIAEQRGVDEALRIFPDCELFILSIKNSDFKIVQKSLVQDLMKFKSAF